MLDCFNKVLDDFSLIFLYPLDRTMKCKILCHGPYKRRLFASSSLCRVREPFEGRKIFHSDGTAQGDNTNLSCIIINVDIKGKDTANLYKLVVN